MSINISISTVSFSSKAYHFNSCSYLLENVFFTNNFNTKNKYINDKELYNLYLSDTFSP